MIDNHVYPISEIFTSPQGEGVYTGVLMTFIRLSGCCVGKPFPKERYKAKAKVVCCGHCDVDFGHLINCTKCKQPCPMANPDNYIDPLPIYTEMCTLYDGRTFECDTDYRVKERLTTTEICKRIPEDVEHICITGGEPFIHDLNSLVDGAENRGCQVHIETSGTVPIHKAFPPPGPKWETSPWEEDVWITVAPKRGVLTSMLERADEIKFLVDEGFDIEKIPEYSNADCVVYLQPVNQEFTINQKNLNICLELQKHFPHYRISTQAHKIWNVR